MTIKKEQCPIPILLAILAACGGNGGNGGGDADVVDIPTDRDVDAAGDDGPVLTCNPGSGRCDGTEHVRCSADGMRWEADPCAPAERCDTATGTCLCASGETSVSGRVFFPNGTDPVSKALIYIPRGEPDVIPSSPACVVCRDASEVVATTTTDVTGAFTLSGIPSKGLLVVEKGYFRRTVELDVAPCTATELDAESLRLPRNRTEGNIPNIAVVKGEWDRLADALERVGLEAGQFDVADESCSIQTECDSRQLMLSLDAMMSYHMIFINCGPVNEDLLLADHTKNRVATNMLAYTRAGGRVYITDEAYDFVEQSFPGFLDFAGCDEVPDDEPEDLDCAQCGQAVSVAIPGRVLDADLAAWLAALGYGTGGSVELWGFLRGWVPIDHGPDDASLPRIDDRLVFWVEGDVAEGQGCLTGTRPMMVTVDVECGKVLFSSFHTVYGSTDITVQEKILEYLVFELGSCFEEIIPV
jgi:hypothetical protein